MNKSIIFSLILFFGPLHYLESQKTIHDIVKEFTKQNPAYSDDIFLARQLDGISRNFRLTFTEQLEDSVTKESVKKHLRNLQVTYPELFEDSIEKERFSWKKFLENAALGWSNLFFVGTVIHTYLQCIYPEYFKAFYNATHVGAGSSLYAGLKAAAFYSFTSFSEVECALLLGLVASSPLLPFPQLTMDEFIGPFLLGIIGALAPSFVYAPLNNNNLCYRNFQDGHIYWGARQNPNKALPGSQYLASYSFAMHESIDNLSSVITLGLVAYYIYQRYQKHLFCTNKREKIIDFLSNEYMNSYTLRYPIMLSDDIQLYK